MKKLLTSLIIVLLFLSSYSQLYEDEVDKLGVLPVQYRDSLINDYFLHKEYYKNGNLKYICQYIDLKNDDIDGYIQIGSSYGFHRNGKQNFKIFTENPVEFPDTSYKYKRNGKIDECIIHNNINSNLIGKQVIISTVKDSCNVIYRYVVSDKGFTKIPLTDTFKGKSAYSLIPNRVLSYSYVKGILKSSTVLTFEPIIGAYEYSSIANVYSKQGLVKRSLNMDSLNLLYHSRSPQKFQVENNKLIYKGKCSTKDSIIIGESLKIYKSPFLNKYEMYKGYYIVSSDTVDCYIAQHYDNVIGTEHHHFIIAKTVNDTRVLSYRDMDEYLFRNEAYLKFWNGNFDFVKLISCGLLELYQLNMNFSSFYLLKQEGSNSIYIFLPNESEKDIFENSGPQCILKGNELRLKKVTGENQIINTLLTIPEFNAFIEKKIRLGIYSYNDLKYYVQEFNNNNR